jgi:hypothetical protein
VGPQIDGVGLGGIDHCAAMKLQITGIARLAGGMRFLMTGGGGMGANLGNAAMQAAADSIGRANVMLVFGGFGGVAIAA